jgi:hypothetical protein
MQIRSSDLEIPTDDPFENDCLDRKKLEPPLTQFVTQAVGPFVLAVDGSWGSGKTTFLKMWQVKLDKAGHLCLYLNAWKTDFVQDPLVAVVGELSIAIKKHPLDRLDQDNVRKTIEKIEKTARSIVKRLIPVSAKLLTLGALDIDSALERELSTGTGVVAENLIQDYKKGKTDIEAFREDLEFLANAIKEPNQDPVKIVIIIDELDRCRPTYAVQLLERIKHLFDVEGVVFILGIDREQLSHSIKALYGSEFEAKGYLKRFIDLDYRLPEPMLGCYCSALFASFKIDELMLPRREHQDNRYDIEDLNHYLGYLMSAAQMSLRDQEQVVSRLRVILQTIPTNSLLFPVTLSILLFLREYDRDKYTSVVNGNMTCKDFLSFVKRLPSEKQAYQEFTKMARGKNYGGFFEERMEGTFLSGLSEMLRDKVPNSKCPELQEYIDMLQSSGNSSNRSLIDTVGNMKEHRIVTIVEIAQGQRNSFKTTDERLNLTSNFVRN